MRAASCEQEPKSERVIGIDSVKNAKILPDEIQLRASQPMNADGTNVKSRAR